MLNLTRAFYVVIALIAVALVILGSQYVSMRQNAIRINHATNIMVRDQQLIV